MKGLALAISFFPLAVVGGGKDIYGNDLTRTNLLGYVDGGATTVGDIADFARGGADTNAVRSLIDASFVGGTQTVNRVTGDFDGVSNRVAEIEAELPGVSNRVDSLETATNNLSSLVSGLTSQTNTWNAKLSKEVDPTVGLTNNTVYASGTNRTFLTEHQDIPLVGIKTNGVEVVLSNKIANLVIPQPPAVSYPVTDVQTNGVSVMDGTVAKIAIPQGMTTNAVSGIITNHVTTGYLCTVAAAQAKADAAEAAAKGYTDETMSDPESEFEGKARLAYKADYANFLENSGEAGRLVPNDNDRWSQWSGSEVYNVFAYLSELPTPEDDNFKAAFAPKTTTETAIANLSTTSATQTAQIDQWENYWRGDRVRLSVTNYYGNTSGELPRLRIEEFDHSTTTVVDNVQVISNFFHTVWDETDRQTNYMTQTDAKIVAVSNSVMESAWRQTNLQLANKAPRAWQSVTSAGEDAPPNMVWHTAPNTVFAGGTEYAHVAVGEGSICVLTDRGAPVYTDGAEGQFRFQDQTGENYFGFDVRSAYKIGCRTDGISVDPAQHIVSLTYDLTSATDPSILCSTNLVDWADAEVEWEQNPPAGTKVCYINVGNQPQGFYQAEIRYAGGSKFLTNMQADLMGGIAASNEVLGVTQSIYPTITATGVVWKVKQ